VKTQSTWKNNHALLETHPKVIANPWRDDWRIGRWGTARRCDRLSPLFHGITGVL